MSEVLLPLALLNRSDSFWVVEELRVEYQRSDGVDHFHPEGQTTICTVLILLIDWAHELGPEGLAIGNNPFSGRGGDEGALGMA